MNFEEQPELIEFGIGILLGAGWVGFAIMTTLYVIEKIN